MQTMYGPKSVGGAFMANRMKYIEAGMENENYYGWGLEDHERYQRWKKLEYRTHKVDGPLFHLSHGRGTNSRYHNPMQANIKHKILSKTKAIEKSGLHNLVLEWQKERGY